MDGSSVSIRKSVRYDLAASGFQLNEDKSHLPANQINISFQL